MGTICYLCYEEWKCTLSKIMTPEGVLDLQVKEFNKGNISFLMTLYENGACFASEPGQVVEDLKNIRQSLQSFIDMRSKLEAKVKRVLQANDLTLLITEMSINGTKPDGKSINLTGRGTVILRRQSDGNWLMVKRILGGQINQRAVNNV
jgi:ketosteroid isomerase-like protein